MTQDIISQIRKIRWKIDQELVRRNHRPLFPQNYMDTYEKEEFLLDADMEFYKVKKLLEKSPKLLRDDPLLSIDYHKIIGLIRQKKLVERTSDHFSPENAANYSWYDTQDLERDRLATQRQELARYSRMLKAQGEAGGKDPGERDSLDLNADDTGYNVRMTKKAELKQKKAIIQQFDKVATNFQNAKSNIGRDQTVTTKHGSEIVETAGMIKKRARDKSKKEKTLGAKLRLKTKKGGGDK